MNLIKNKIKIILLMFSIIIFMPLYSLAASKGTITEETVRMRKEPTTESDIVTLLSQDFEVEILAKEGTWYKVNYKDYTGYVSAEFVKIDENENNETDTQNNENEEPKVENTNTQTEVTKPEETEKLENNEEEIQISINSTQKINKQSNMYYLPLIHSEVISVIEQNQDVNIIQIAGKWAYVTSINVSGWIKVDNMKTQSEIVNKEETANKPEEKKDENQETTNTTTTTTENAEKPKEPEENTKKIGYINAENVNFREEADKSSEVIDTLTLNTEVEIIDEQDGWYKVKVNNQTGYVATTLVSDEKLPSSRSQEVPRTIENTQAVVSKQTNENSNIQTQIVEYAKTFLGYPYVYGGTTPSGFDCSGFVQYVYKHFGYSVSRSSVSQAKDGKEVSLENLQKGDIVIFKAYNDYSRIGHVGIYIGANQFIHANDEKTGVIITSLSKGKYPERFVCGRRII